MNAKETIKKIADALNIGDAAEKEVKVEDTKTVEQVEEVKAEATEDKVEDVKAETTEDAKTEEVTEAPKVEVETEENKEDAKIADLQKQVDELSKLLEVAVSKEVKEDVIPEIPEDKVEPLTHSPESTPETTTKKIGGHGGDVLSRVYKYMS